jgi:hypothetical protein
MPAARTTTIRHLFGGGWATDYGPTVDISPDFSGKVGGVTGRVVIPFLVDAENVLFELDGGPHKIGGATKVNSVQLASGAAITGLYDYWREGAAGTPSRKRVLHAGTVIMNDNNDATFVNLFTGMTSGAVPSYSTFDDLLIMANDSGVDVPKSWDQTTAQDLAGSPPTFAFSCMHKNRQWAAGVQSHPSRLYYSANVDPTDWTGVGSGSIDIDISDGDQITGLASHMDSLWVFKGPNKGSIHRITGSSPTGSDAFARITFVRGLGAAWHNSIFQFSDDLGFVSQFGSIHSLSAAASFGDFEEASLSRPINIGWIRQHLNYSRLRYISAVTDPLAGIVYFTASWDASPTNNMVLAMDFRRAPDVIAWSKISAYSMASLGLFVDSSGLRRVLGGGNDGYVRRLNVSDRSIDTTTAIQYKVTTPTLNYGNPILLKTLERGSVGIAPKGAFTETFGWQRDGNAQQTTTFVQGGADVLGTASANQFTLGTSALGGAQFVDRFMEFETGGEFRGIQYQITDNGNYQDLEVHSITVSVTGGAESTESGNF